MEDYRGEKASAGAKNKIKAKAQSEFTPEFEKPCEAPDAPMASDILTKVAIPSKYKFHDCLRVSQ